MRNALVFCLLLLCAALSAQRLDNVRLNKMVQSRFAGINLSQLWQSGDTDLVQVGFVGARYTRFRIHFTHVAPSPKQPDTYLVSGRTKVWSNVNSFEGELHVDSVALYDTAYDFWSRDTIRTAGIWGTYYLREKRRSAGTGVMRGRFHTDVYIDRNYHVHYDDVTTQGDNGGNNHFNGTWTSYKDQTRQQCNWGDGRVDSCGDLDVGIGSFYVNRKYMLNGWKDYWNNPPSTKEHLEEYLRDKKRSQWWK